MPLDKISFEEAADNRQENVVIGVSVGDADAGFIAEDAFNVADKYIALGSVVKLVETAWLPNWALSLDRSLPDDFKQKLRESAVALGADDPVIKAIDITGFKAANDSDYEIVRGGRGRPVAGHRVPGGSGSAGRHRHFPIPVEKGPCHAERARSAFLSRHRYGASDPM